MMMYFDFLSRPIPLQAGRISVLVIENKACFRKTVEAILNGTAEEENIVLSERNQPIKFKSCAQLIKNYIALDCSAQQLKSIYADMSSFCNAEMREETLQLSQQISEYLEKLNEEFDFDFSYNLDLNLPELFKMKGLKPDQVSKGPMEILLDLYVAAPKIQPYKVFYPFKSTCILFQGRINGFIWRVAAA